MRIKILRVALLLSTALAVILLASYALSISCCRSASRIVTAVTACAQIEGTNPDNSSGYAKGVSSGIKSCNLCIVNTAFLETYSGRTGRIIKFFSACPYGENSQVYQRGSAGGYVFSYVKSWCDGAETSVAAFLYGYYAVSRTEG
ncbi:MAG: hypothetical protein QXF46_04545 [Thermofilaceae archaeon]